MISSIKIENFLCFEDTEISGFEQINLITGRNNVGKTAFLEAILLGLRKHFTFPQIPRFNNIHSANISYTHDGILHEGEVSMANVLIYNSQKQIPTLNYNKPGNPLGYAFDKIEKAGKSDLIVEGIRIVEPKLDTIRTFSDSEGLLFIRKKGEIKYQPLDAMGDAVQKIVRYLVNIIEISEESNEPKVLLIDEIENGIHYTAHRDFWRMLFKLCIAYDIQLFAVTHSEEMLRAYQEISTEFEGKAGYFKLVRDVVLDKILGMKYPMDLLEDAIEDHYPIRG